jgi:hypothetical protein
MTKVALHKLVILVGVGCGGDDAEPSVDAAPPVTEVDAFMIDAPQCTATADSCPGESICIANRCEAAFGRIYDIRSIHVMVPTLDPGGLYWDIGGGAPDLTVRISINGVERAATGTVNDQFSASFPGPHAVQPIGGGSLYVAAYDEDVTNYDFAYGCLADPLTAEMLRTRRVACASGGNSLQLAIEPR